MIVKKKICKGCRRKFTPWSTTQQVCSTSCAIVLNDRKNSEKAKQQKKADRLKREALRPRSWYVKKAQEQFNKFIRERDKNELCISCQRRTGSKINAGHYLSCGARSELRYHQSNCHLQCEKCNSWLSGNAVLYRKNLLEKVGAEMVDYLENFNIPQRWTIEDLKEIAQHYKDELKYLKAGE